MGKRLNTNVASLLIIMGLLLFLALRVNAADQLPVPLVNIVDHIKTVQSKSIISITGDYHAKTNILKADKIVFDDGGKLVFDKIDNTYIAIIAKEIVFAAPKYRASIRRNTKIKKHLGGTIGSTPTNAPPTPPKAANRRGGTNGGNGSNGGTGGKGKTFHLPPVIVAASLVTQQNVGTQRKGFVDLRIYFDGLEGGDGGKGGNGGPGGKGGGGGDGVTGAVGCLGGPGNGGNGGTGGKGGQGGPGGDGGNGADIYYLGSRDALDELEIARVANRGGFHGRGGPPGNPGAGGKKGARGARRGSCIGGEDGSIGSAPNPRNLGKGADSETEGGRGKIRSYEYNVAMLF